MEFVGDIFSLERPTTRKISLLGASLPSSKDVYFRSKQKEIIEQYSAARIFMNETENTDWDHWFNRVEQEDAQQYFELTFKAYFYEVALTYYNIVVDLSWTACYLATEFALTHQGERINFGGIRPIEEAFELMRKAENLVTKPNAEENPFGYLKVMCPEFSTAIEMIIDFWSWYGQSNIRQRYNFCKHKGKPIYTEIQELSGPRLMGFYQEDHDGNRVQLVSDPSDVRLQCSLDESIEELRQFDNTQLFPYISKLFAELECVLNPSPFV